MLNERVYIHQGSPQIDWFSWDEIFQTVTEDDGLWEIYIKVPFFLNSNVARIILSSLHLKWHFLCSSQIFDLCLIYGNESRNGRPSHLGIKLEMNNSALQLGICKIRLWSLKFLSAKNKNLQLCKPQRVYKNFKESSTMRYE